MGSIYYNSWLEEYKKPFGAVQEKAFVRFAVQAADDTISQVFLVINKEGHSPYEIPLENFGTRRYRYEFFFNDGKGLYFYHFKFISLDLNGEEIIRYYGVNEQGGDGVIEENLENVHRYVVTCYEKAEVAPKWYREAIFYQIFPDRFYNGNENQLVNSPKPDSFIYGQKTDEPMYIKNEFGEILRWDFFGGNFKGIQAKIPYLKKLGINALYLNPIFEAFSNHRYDTADYLKTDPVLGSEEDFKELLAELRKNEIRVILDGVFSHVGRNSRYFNFDGSYGEGEGAYQTQESPYYPWFTFTNYPDEYRSWWNVKDLPEINKHNPDFQEFIYGKNSVMTKWNQLGIDGWRLDVADELPDEFIAGIRNNLDQYQDKVLLGEVWEDASNKISYDVRRQYILGNHLHGVMNYPLRKAVLELLNQEATPEAVARTFTQLYANYPRDVFYNSLNNIGTHDTERILSMLQGDKQKLSLAFAMMLLFPGVPCIYYGDEAGLTGGKDPENRKFFPWDSLDETCYKACKQWIDLRKENPVIVNGDFELLYTEKIFGILRYDQTDYVLLLINLNDHEETLYAEAMECMRRCPVPLSEMKQILDHQLLMPHEAKVFNGKF